MRMCIQPWGHLRSQQGEDVHVPLTFSPLLVLRLRQFIISSCGWSLLVWTGSCFPPRPPNCGCFPYYNFYKMCFYLFLDRSLTHTLCCSCCLLSRSEALFYPVNHLYLNKACARHRHEQPAVSEVASVMMECLELLQYKLFFKRLQQQTPVLKVFILQ